MQRAWLAGERAWMQLARRETHTVFFRKCYHRWSGYTKSGGSSRSHLLLYGAVAFVWERERISEEDVKSCVRGYMGRVTGEGGVSSNTPVTLESDHTSSSASGGKLYSRLYTPPPRPGSTPPPSGPTPPPSGPTPSSKTVPDSACTSAGLLSRLDKRAQSRLAPPTGNVTDSAPPEEALPWSRRFSGWFDRAATKQGGEVSPSTLPSSSPGSYVAWSRSWFSEEPFAESRTEVETHADQVPPPDGESRKREEFVREYLRVYRAHSHDCVLRLPLMGMAKERGGARPLRQGMQVLERVVEKTQAKVIGVLAYHLSHMDQRLDHFTHEDAPSSVCDMACIGADMDTSDQGTTPSMHSGNWVSYYMQVERVDEAESQATPPSVDVWEPYMEHPVLLKALQPLLDNVKLLVALGQEHLKDQLLVEGAFFVDQQVPMTLREAGLELRDTVRSLWSEALERYMDGSVASRGGKTSLELSTGGPRELVPGSSPLAGQRQDGTVFPGQDAIKNADRAAQLLGWEFVTGDRDYTAYRKPYKDSGLFQYKVIGRYDDITARDFHEAQVDHNFRKTWDVYAGDIVTLDTDAQSDSSLIHWVMKYPFPMCSREYLFVQRSWISAEKDTIVIIKRSTSHPDVPDTGKCVRVKDYYSQMVICAHSGVDELGMDFELTYFDNPQTQLPSSCVNWVASTAMPDFMSKIHTAAVTRQRE